MKSYSYKISKKEEKQQTNLWDAFVNHIKTNYFPGASELLDSKLIAFEYEAFKDVFFNKNPANAGFLLEPNLSINILLF